MRAYDRGRWTTDRSFAERRAACTALLSNLGEASFDEIRQVMEERAPVAPDKGLGPEAVAKLAARIAKQRAVRKSKRKAA